MRRSQDNDYGAFCRVMHAGGEMSSELISVECARTLSHVALLAAWEGDSVSAEYLFVALQKSRPQDIGIRVCRAMVFACEEKFEEAKALLKQVLHERPSSASAKSLLGFVLFSTGEHGWQMLLEEVVADASDSAASELASEILEEHREFSGQSTEADPSGHNLIPYA
jgi:hypothetical protein